MPVVTPKGVGGIQPNLAINYSSYAGMGDLGVGWGISGLSRITRCNSDVKRNEPHHAVDYSYRDKFCLDGMRLVLVEGQYGVHGSEYRTEYESFKKIIAIGKSGNGPRFFRVFEKNGKVYEYGLTDESIINASNRAEVKEWAISKIYDKFNNYLEISYSKAQSKSYRVSRISYSGNSDAGVPHKYFVNFKYNENLKAIDKSFGYESGTPINSDWLLESIDVLSVDVILRSYKFNYENTHQYKYARLASIQECVSGNCDNEIKVSWLNNSAVLESASPAKVIIDSSSNGANIRSWSHKGVDEGYYDMNNDGFVDRVWNPEGSNSIMVSLNDKNGDFLRPTEWLSSNSNGAGLRPFSPHGSYDQFVDVNNDGFIDFVWRPEGRNDFWVSLGDGTKFKPPTMWLDEYSKGSGMRSYSADGKYEKYIDMNNDGRVDKVWRPDGRNEIWVALNTGSTFARPDWWLDAYSRGHYFLPYSYNGWHESFIDINGDGLTDRVWVPQGRDREVWVALNNGSALLKPVIWLHTVYGLSVNSYQGQHYHYADLNGDGLPDRVWVPENNSNLYAAINTGKGFSQPQIWLNYNSNGNGIRPYSHYGKHERFVDVNNDGKEDFVWRPANSEHIMVALSLGDRFATPMVWVSKNQHTGGLNTASQDGAFEDYVDINGDGFVDRVWLALGRGEIRTVLNPFTDQGLVSGVKNSFNHETKFHYLPLHDSKVYEKPKVPSVYPVADIVSAQPVVSKVELTNGIGGYFESKYFYRNKKFHVAGEGDLGFGQIKVTSPITNTETTTTFSQDYAKKTVGVTNTILTQFSPIFGSVLSLTVNKWGIKESGQGASYRYNRQILSTGVVKHDLNWRFLSREENSYKYDDFDNITELKNQVYDSPFFWAQLLRTNTVTNEYSNDESNWLLGLMTATTSTTQTNAVTQTKKTAWEYETNKGYILKEKTLDPNTNAVLHQKSYENPDTFGNIQKVVTSGANFAPREVLTSFDASGRYITSIRNALGHTSTNTYYPDNHINAGLVDVSIDANGFRTKYFYDSYGRKTKVIKFYGTAKAVESYSSFQWCKDVSYCPANAVYLITSSSQGGAANRVYIDALGRTLQKSGQLLDGRFSHVLHEYNTQGLNHKISEPYFDGDTILWTSIDYDAKGRMVKTTLPSGRVDEVVYNGLERISRLDVNGKNLTKKQYRDHLNNLIRVVDNDNNEIRYEYDSLGQITKVIAPNNIVTQIFYDSFGRKIKMNDPDKGTWHYSYNALGQMITQTDALGVTLCTAYDVLGRMVKRVDHYTGTKSSQPGAVTQSSQSCAGSNPGQHTASWQYDSAGSNAKGLLHKVLGNDYTDTYNYNAYGQLERNSKTIGQESYHVDMAYDNLHRLDRLDYPGSIPATRVSVKHTYNNLGFLIKQSDYNNNAIWYYEVQNMDARGNITKERYGNGATTVRRYNNQQGFIESIQSRDITGGLTIQNLSFNFDVLGNVIERNDHLSAYVESFEYDNLNRLSTTSSNMDNSGNQTTSISYDALGNILSKTGVGSYKYGSQCGGSGAGPHAVCQITAGTIGTKNASYRYNANGDMISGDGRTIQYTAFGKPSEIIQSGRMVKIQYGPDRNRYRRTDTVAGKNTQYTYINGLYEKVVSSTKTEERHFIGANVVLSLTNRSLLNAGRKEIRYLHKDHIGSISAITDGTSLVEERHSFDAWGKRRAPDMQTLVGKLGAWSTLTTFQKGNTTLPAFALSSIITNKGFTGHEQLDPVGLIHMNGRVYDADIGRFISADPFIEDRSNLQSLNRYTYVRNNPLSYTDPSGYFSFKKKFRKAWRSVRNHAKKGLRSLRGHVKKHLIKVGSVINKVPYLSTAVGIVIAVVGSPAAAAIYFKILAALNAAIALANGGEITSLAVGFAVGYITVGVTDAVGSALGGSIAAQYVSGALVGAVTAKAMGGSANDGAIGGALSVGVRHAMGEFRENKASAKNNSSTKDVVAYVGGAGDSTFGGPVKKHADGENYFDWSQKSKLAKWIDANQGNNITVIGHSWGADTAASVIANGHYVDTLITVDPVSWFRPDFSKVAANTGKWINYDSTSTQANLSNFVAKVGGAWNDAPKKYVTSQRYSSYDHAYICFEYCKPQ